MKKEIKYYFQENNSLNKGFHEPQTEQAQVNQELLDLMPEPEVLLAYEEIAPGTLQKLVNLMSEEQKHKHKMELKSLQIQKWADIAGKICFITLCSILGYVMLQLVNINLFYGLILIFSSFLGFFYILYLAQKSNNHSKRSATDTQNPEHKSQFEQSGRINNFGNRKQMHKKNSK